jgi:hypothetical protein
MRDAGRPVVDRVVLLAWVVVFAAPVLGGCSFTEVKEEETPIEPVILIDETGKRWDVTTAVNKYGFEVDRFESGLGPRAIEPLIEPEMLSPGDSGYPAGDAPFPVIGTTINGDARAYGKLDLTDNEIVDDWVGEAPVVVAYCPPVDMAAVYSRVADGDVVTLSASGWTYDRLFVLYDFETESLWYRLPGTNGLTCVAGHYEGLELPEVVSAVEPWNAWRASFPNTKVLAGQFTARR